MNKGTIIKLFRECEGLSQKQLSDLFQVNQSNISRIEGNDDLMFDLQERVLNYFGIYDIKDQGIIQTCFHKISQGAYYHFPNVVNQSYQKLNQIKEVNFNDYLLKQHAIAMYLIYSEQFKELKELLRKLECFLPFFDDILKQNYHFLQGASLQREHKIMESYQHFLESYRLMEELKIYHGPLMVMMVTINLFFKHYGSSYTICLRAIKQTYRDHNLYRRSLLEFNLGMIFFFEGHFEEAIPYILQLYRNEQVLKDSFFLKHQCNSLLGVSYLILGDYEQALVYLTDSIDHPITEIFIEYTFWYTLYCFKQLKNKEKFEYYYNQIKEKPIYQDQAIKTFIDVLLPYEEHQENQLLFENLDYLYKEIFCKVEKVNLNRTLFLHLFDNLWEEKQYTHYKNINEMLIKLKLGSVQYEL